MNVLYLTNNRQLASTARILVSWLTLGRDRGVVGHVVTPGTGSLDDWLHGQGIDACQFPMPWPNRRWPFPQLWQAWRLATWARERRVDVIHCNEHDIYPFAVVLRTLLRKPLICHVRFRISREFATWAFGGRRQPDALLWTTRQQREDCAEAVSGVVPDGRQHLVRLGADLATFGSAAVDRDALRARLGASPGDILVGMSGSMRPIKRLDDFIEVVLRLAANRPRVMGLLAAGQIHGDEAYAARILARIATCGLGERLRCLGHLEPVEPFLRALDVFVSTSEYETFGNSVCEAMACRLPVAAYAGGSVQEVVGDAGTIVPTGDVDQLVRAVAEFVDDAMLRTQYGQRAVDRVSSEFNPSTSFETLMGIYESLTTRTTSGV